VAAYQHRKHENSHIVVCSLFRVTQALGVDENYIDSFAALCLNWNRFVPNPETLRASRCFASYDEATRSADQVVDDERLAAAIFTSNCNY
jgi:hypothetical protein